MDVTEHHKQTAGEFFFTGADGRWQLAEGFTACEMFLFCVVLLLTCEWIWILMLP